MSMLSAMCDKLRSMADRDTVPWDVSSALCDAANTIWELRNDLQEANRVHEIDMEVVGCMVHPEIVERLEAENAKLRELAKNALTYIMYEGCGIENPCPKGFDPCETCAYCPRFDTDCCAFAVAQYAKELGIEV